MTLWLVHAGKYGEREQMAREKNLAIIGWEELPDLSQLKSREALARLLKETYPEEKNRTLSNWESQLWSFSKTMQVGDLVAMPLKARPVIVFGTVTGSTIRAGFPERFKHTVLYSGNMKSPQYVCFGPALLFCCSSNCSQNCAERCRDRIKARLAGVPNLLVQLQKLKRPSTWSS